jgi:hypothetical protein
MDMVVFLEGDDFDAQILSTEAGWPRRHRRGHARLRLRRDSQCWHNGSANRDLGYDIEASRTSGSGWWVFRICSTPMI